ncbi:PEP-CTERM sorting domain-containing protein [Massilia atriviolacea]|uniref:PEP-CTERM sorting domain-containing protein n=2 Tax=Massilia atriviolacea TaxID=2495579 RepID=A0A430HRH5_9BURK|nr:PEP-CTERM sorting domain-containing protein [Massilia atriviolacea]
MNDRIVGRFSYDSSARMERGSLDNPPYDPASTDYFYHGAYASPTDFFTFKILPSGQTVSAGDRDALTRRVTLADGKVGTPNSRDSLSIDSGGYDVSFGIGFSNASSTWISDGTLPQQLSLADVTSASVYHYFYRADGNRIMLSGVVTSLTDVTVTPVPEPGTWAMLLAGLSILGVSARRKRG